MTTTPSTVRLPFPQSSLLNPHRQTPPNDPPVTAADGGNPNSPWQRVTVLKRNEEGQFHINAQTRQPQRKTYIEDTRTGELYLDETVEIVATKCCNILIGNPIYTGAIMLSNFICIIQDTITIAARAIKSAKENFSEGKPLIALLDLLKAFFWEIPQAILIDLFSIVCAPIYGVGIELAALYGIFNAYEGRKWVRIVEGSMHSPRTYKDDVRYLEEQGRKCEPQDICCDSKLLFLAFCFTVRGRMDETITLPDNSTVSKFVRV